MRASQNMVTAVLTQFFQKFFVLSFEKLYKTLEILTKYNTVIYFVGIVLVAKFINLALGLVLFRKQTTESREDHESLGELERSRGDGFTCLLPAVNKPVISHRVYTPGECSFIKLLSERWGSRTVYWAGCQGVKESSKSYWDKTYVRRFERFKSTSKKKYQILWFSLKNTNTMFERWGEKRFQFSSGYSTKNQSNENLKIGFVCKHKLHVFRDIHCTCGVRDSSSWLKLHLLS